jgi:phosphonopyruvate decarboxylase
MISPKKFTDIVIKNNLGPIIQVPCSYFKNLLNYIISTGAIKIINPVNEGVAMGIATGEFLSTSKIPIVMIQNSGLLNTLNALTSLNQIYEIPIFYIITWRGQDGVGTDAPEHDIVGENLEQILTTFQIPYEIIDENTYENQVVKLQTIAQKTNLPVALIIKKDQFEDNGTKVVSNNYKMDRYEILKIIKDKLSNDSLFVSSNGYPSRDSFTVKPTPDFYMMGSMGHTFSIALGISENVKKKIVIFDGDGSSLMHVGGLASFNPSIHKNLLYIVIDNEVYESTGGQPTVSKTVNYKYLSKAFGFKKYNLVKTKKELLRIINKIQKINDESVFLHIKVNYDILHKSIRVSEKYTAPEIKSLFMDKIKEDINDTHSI